MKFERAIIVKGKTRLEMLLDRHNIKSQAKFYIEHNGGNFNEYEDEHNTFYESLASIQTEVTRNLKPTIVERGFLHSFLFNPEDLIVVVGQDGLVANTAKYAKESPIIAVNPDQRRNNGVLLPFNTNNFNQGLRNTIQGESVSRKLTLAQAKMNDGQELLAFNDFYIGKSNHTSSRYELKYRNEHESQSSSGIIVSTQAGSTGWLSSIINEHIGISKFLGDEHSNTSNDLRWNDDKLCFVVREPFKSQNTTTSLVAGFIEYNEVLTIESNMPENGLIFSDGMIDDYLVFNSGSTLTIGTANEKVNLIIN